VILVDTGPLVAAALHGDTNHVRCVEFFTSAHLNAEPLLVPSLVITEIATLDRRHFTAVRPQHANAFTLRPD
jgi:predicted nucleic acid-binding protein